MKNCTRLTAHKSLILLGWTIVVASLSAQPQLAYEWVRTATGPKTDQITAIALDADNNVYVAGQITEYLVLGGDTLFASPQQTEGDEIFLAKYDADGQFLWSQQGGSRYLAYDDEITHLTTDAAGNLYFTGSFRDTLWWEGQFLVSGKIGNTPSGDAFLISLDSNGQVRWMRNDHQALFDHGQDVEVDNQGNIIWASSRGSTGQWRPAIYKFAPNGDTLWIKTFQDRFQVREIAIGPQDQIYLTGFLIEEVAFGSGDTIAPLIPGPDHFVSCLDAQGNVLWAISPEAGNDDRATDIQVDSVGNVFVRSRTNGWVAWGTDTLQQPDPGATENYLVKYGPDGAFITARWAELGSGDIEDMQLDPEGNVWMAGRVNSGGMWGDSVVNLTPGNAVALASFDPDLNFNRFFSNQTHNGTAEGAEIQVMGLAADGELLIGGTYTQGPQLDTFLLPFATSTGDMFWAKIGAEEASVAIVEILPAIGFSVFPNPNKGAFTLSFQAPLTAEVAILDIQGRLWFRESLNGRQEMDINLQGVPAGCYFVQVHTARGLLCQKIMRY